MEANRAKNRFKFNGLGGSVSAIEKLARNLLYVHRAQTKCLNQTN
jgi:hypothetical protein